jgi:Xaa-Pro aminopeptidase
MLAPAEREWREVLFLRPREPEQERWDIERLPLGSELERRTGFDKVRRISALGALATTAAGHNKDLHYLGAYAAPNAPIPPELELYGKIAQRVPGARTIDRADLLVSMRVAKEPREIEMTRKAMAATKRGHMAAMRQVRPDWTELRLKQVLEAEFFAGGGEALSYDSIVGAGRNAASLHYVGGQGPIRAGEMILIDAAAKVGGYTTDVTRTFPVTGTFSEEQKRLYALVLEAQEAAAKKLKAGVYYEELSEAAKAVFRRAGVIDEFYHGLGHFIGLNVHDVGDMTKPLVPGAIVTIEPGLYNQAANYGIRIEDDYLVTATGFERLSEGIPRTIAEIEGFMKEGRG